MGKRAKDAEDEDKPRVAISMIYATKGLEWPIVSIPGAYNGSIPNQHADDAYEERRIFYVGTTRAKALLYVSYPEASSRRESAELSKFLTSPSLRMLFAAKAPSIVQEHERRGGHCSSPDLRPKSALFPS